MRRFTCKTIQDASALPWVWEIPTTPERTPVWGVNIVPIPMWDAFTTSDPPEPIGEPIGYFWEALLDPSDTPLPEWITETTPPPAPVDNTIP